MRAFSLVAIAALAATSAFAQSNPSSGDIINSLTPGQQQPAMGKTRSLGAPKARQIRVEDDEKTVVAAIDLYVPFDYDSDAITERARPVLDQLGTALKDSKLSGFTFVVAGHTDASGSDAYNNDLSERRARSVLADLVATYGIDIGRLKSKGFGEAELKDRNDPEGAANRRVEILNVGP